MATPLAPLRGLISQLPFTNLPLKVYPVTSAKTPSNSLRLYCYGPGFNDNVTSFDPTSLRWLSFLTFAGIDFQVEYCNEPLMAPNNRLPFLMTPTNECIADDAIYDYLVRTYGDQLPTVPTDTRPASAFALLTLIDTHVKPAVQHYFWYDEANYREQISVAYTGQHQWPIRWVEATALRKQNQREVALQFTDTVSGEEIYERALHTLRDLASYLGEQDTYFFGAARPTLVDAALFAYLFPVLTSTMPNSTFKELVKNIPRLSNYIRALWDQWFRKREEAA
ncbi:Metaxin-2 [Dispira parvispora]|uniref:Metaxin-2 n=1 Tax=Dispira parvispora TaxID=1520584 RepID=A0A9W8AS37_9FUNG|nr:Metaxin-2 [Dispira parvispora]